MRINSEDNNVNPFHFALSCIGGKWKMIILYKIYTHDNIRFNHLLRLMPLSEKVLSHQLKELLNDGLIKRVVFGETTPPSVAYILTDEGRELIPSLDILYLWSARRLNEAGVEIDNFEIPISNSNAYNDNLEKVTIKLEKTYSSGNIELATFDMNRFIGFNPDSSQK